MGNTNVCCPIPWDVSHGIPIGMTFTWTSLMIRERLCHIIRSIETVDYQLCTHFVCRWNSSSRMTPDEAMNHEWIMEGRFEKGRGQSRHVNRRHAPAMCANNSSAVQQGVLAPVNTAAAKPEPEEPGKALLSVKTGNL